MMAKGKPHGTCKQQSWKVMKVWKYMLTKAQALKRKYKEPKE